MPPLAPPPRPPQMMHNKYLGEGVGGVGGGGGGKRMHENVDGCI